MDYLLPKLNIYSRVSSFLDKKDKFKFKLILLLNCIVFFFEFLSLASIPIFVSLAIDPNYLLEKMNMYFGNSFISEFSNEKIMLVSTIFVISAFVLKNCFFIFLTYLQGNFFKKIKSDVANKLFSFYINSPLLYHLKNNPSQLSRNISDEIQGLYNYLFHFISLIREILAILVIITLLGIVNPSTTFIIFLLLGFLILIYFKIIKPRVRKKAKKNQELRKSITQTIYETFGSIKDLKILAKEKEITTFFNKFIKNYEENLYHFVFYGSFPKFFLEMFSITLIIIVSFIYFSLNQDFVALFPMLSLIVISVVRFIPAFNSIIVSSTYMKIFEASVDLLSNEINSINSANNQEAKKSTYLSNEPNLNIKKFFFSVEKISFSYPESKLFPLKDVSLTIEEGSKVGITGETGAGKSTLFHIMLGLLEPKTGNIFYKGQDIFKNLYQWRKEIGYISQNIYLLDSSIKKNIAFNFLNEPIDNKKLEKAINIAHLSNKISELSDGINTKVGTDGLKLSGGERQRIALARAIYREPNIFFMDESTSSLDLKTEEIIMNNIKNNFNDKTIIMIAHRKSTIDKCDKVLNLENGSIN